MQHDQTAPEIKKAGRLTASAMEAAVCLHSKQTVTRRPLRDLFSINQRRNIPRKHHLISLPIFAHSHRQAYSHVNPTPSLSQPPSPPETLKCRNADGQAAGSGATWPRAAMAGLVLACALAGSACMRPACARGGTQQKNMNKAPTNVTTVAIEAPDASIESSSLEKTRMLLSGILLTQKRPTTNFGDSYLLALLGEYYFLTRDVEGTHDLLFRNFSKEKERVGGDDPRILLVNIYIAMKEYEKARKVCETLIEDEKDGPSFPDPRPSLQRAVIYMMLAVEKMLEPKAKEQDGTLMIEKAKQSWKSYFREDLQIAKVFPPDAESPPIGRF